MNRGISWLSVYKKINIKTDSLLIQVESHLTLPNEPEAISPDRVKDIQPFVFCSLLDWKFVSYAVPLNTGYHARGMGVCSGISGYCIYPPRDVISAIVHVVHIPRLKIS